MNTAERAKKIQHREFCELCGKVDSIELRNSLIECSKINNLNLETKLYRILSYDLLRKSLEGQCLYMTRACNWEDPAETFLLHNKRLEHSDGSLVNLDLMRKKIYAQCWSRTEESNALWKIYSLEKIKGLGPLDFQGKVFFENHKTVRIKSTGNKLINSLYDMNIPFFAQSCFIGYVEYCEDKDINELREKKLSKILCNEENLLIQHLFFKRNAYEYENEARLIFMAHDIHNNNPSKTENPWDIRNDYLPLNIDINNVIEEITFHPKLEDDEYEKMKAEIKKLGYMGIINKSALFARDNRILPF